ncbi:MAG: lactate dehydrogenase [Gammaproteobacteria bacterium]|nr:lactate dehydrogenase [Gammaproteobacteria bacterium]|tara:strand:- start:2450 stop:3505 length:1056 start_codon:yes stop_codon:yes gene_type:complete
MSERYRPEDLVSFVSRLFQGAGLAEDRARAMADTFVAADLLGFTTHGMQRVPINLDWLDRGETRATGEPRVLRDRPGTFSWDADFLPGPWVVHRAMTEAAARARRNGIAAATLQRCTHVACLAAYLLPLLEDGLVGLMTVSTPDERFISPFGGREAVFSNNPVAFCAPTSDAPLLFDVSMAITAGGQIARAAREGRRLPEACLKTAAGEATDDPDAMSTDPPGTVMPIGGLGHGHKGYALTLLTEVLSQALGGHGRRDAAGEGEANSVYLQVVDPRAFSEWDDYLAEVDHLLDACRQAAPDDPAAPVRVPGESAWRRRGQALAQGLAPYQGVMAAMAPWAERLGVEMPRAV